NAGLVHMLFLNSLLGDLRDLASRCVDELELAGLGVRHGQDLRSKTRHSPTLVCAPNSSSAFMLSMRRPCSTSCVVLVPFGSESRLLAEHFASRRESSGLDDLVIVVVPDYDTHDGRTIRLNQDRVLVVDVATDAEGCRPVWG